METTPQISWMPNELHHFPVAALPVMLMQYDQNSNSNGEMDYDEGHRILDLGASPPSASRGSYAMSPDSGYGGDDNMRISTCKWNCTGKMERFHSCHCHCWNSDSEKPGPTHPYFCQQSSGATLTILDEPETSYRFRYMKESQKPHGPLKGRSSTGKTPKNSTGPRVQLRNFNGEAVIRVWLYCEDEKDGPSPHRLVTVVNKDVIVDEPHDIIVNADNNYTASFNKLNILHVVTNDEEYQKLYLRKERSLGRTGSPYINVPPKVEGPVDGRHLKNVFRKKNKNICSLRFEAFEKKGDQYIFIGAVMSQQIKNTKSPKTNGLRIVKASHVEGTCLGGTEILIFTEKLIKEVKIIFFDDDNWQADALFKESDIHHQVGVAFRTPPYKNTDITSAVEVMFKLLRTTDGEESEYHRYRYQPRRDNMSYSLSHSPVKRKKRQVPNDPMLSDTAVVEQEELLLLRDELLASDGDSDNFLSNLEQSLPSEPSVTSNQVTLQISDSAIKRPLSQEAAQQIIGSGRQFMRSNGNMVNTTRPIFNNGTTELTEKAGSGSTYQSYHKHRAAISTGDLLHDSIPNIALYHDMCKDSIPTSQGSDDIDVKVPVVKEQESLAERARRLQLCIVQDNESVFTQLLETPNIANYKYANQTPLHLAVKHQRSRMVSDLLKAGANVYELDSIGSNTALHLGVLSSQTCLQLLLRAVEPKAVFNNDGDDPVLYATRNNRRDALELLLMKRFDPSTENVKNGDTPLHVAVENAIKTDQTEIVDLLLKHGASASYYNNAAKTPLHYAVAAQSNKLVQKLIQHCDAEDFTDDDDDELSSRLGLLQLTDEPRIKSILEPFLSPSDGEPKSEETQEPYLALDGNVELSKRVATRLGCAFLIPFLANAERQSQVLLNHLQRKDDSATAMTLLNDALAKESSYS